MAAQESLRLARTFARKRGADRINDMAPRPDQSGGDVEQMRLESGQPVEPRRCQPPAPLRIAPPGPASGTGRVDQDDIRPVGIVMELRHFLARIEKPRGDARAGTLG